MNAKGIIRLYLAMAAATTLAQSLIWGVNTLFLIDAGLDIFGVMLANGAFTLGMLVFEIPTGVIADTLGRRTSYLLAVSTIAVSTVLYVAIGQLKGGIIPFALASILLGLGYTFYTGAVDAWLVDALHSVGYTEKIDPIFGKAGMVFGIFMLIGTVGGGFLGQIALWIPYVVRAIILIPCFVLGFVWMKEMGFTPRPLEWSTVGAESARIGRDGVRFGWNNPVVRPLMWATGILGLFGIFGFYAWQKYFLDLLGQNLVWVAGVVAALIGLTQVAAGALVGPLTKLVPRRSVCLLALTGMMAVSSVGAGIVGLVTRTPASFYVAVALYLVSVLGFGLSGPIKQGWLNACIPSEQRATIISFDALFGDGGGTFGQVGLGYMSRAISIPVAWVLGSAVQALAMPLFLIAGRRSPEADLGEPCVATVHEGGAAPVGAGRQARGS